MFAIGEMGGGFLFGNACLEGTTERSDGNRVRSARREDTHSMCLEGTTPEDGIKHFHRRTAFQAKLCQQLLPGTSYPVTVATLRTAFQAVFINAPTPFGATDIREKAEIPLFLT